MSKILKWIFLFIVILAICIWNIELFLPYISQETGKSRWSNLIPNKDRKRLEYFFRRLILWDNCGYVLMGSKPCVMVAFQEPLNLGFLSPSNVRFWLGWKTWEKYEKHFPHPKFTILKEKKENGTSLLFFVHNSEFIRIVSTHKIEFENFLQRSIEPSQLLIEAQSKPLFGQILKNNDFLFGIILGFGKHNAWTYYSNWNGAEQKVPMVSFIENDDSQHFSNWIRYCGIWGFTKGSLFSDFSHLQLPGFTVDPNAPETLQLRKKYSEIRRKIIDYYDQKNFFDATLALLMAPESK